MPKQKLVATSTAAVCSGILTAIGFSGWCCTLTGAAVLSALGISSLGLALTYNSWWLLLITAALTILAIYYYLQYKSHQKSCARKKNDKRNLEN